MKSLDHHEEQRFLKAVERIAENTKRQAAALERLEDGVEELTTAVADVRNQLKQQVWLKEKELAFVNPTLAKAIGLEKIDYGRLM